MSAPPLSLPLLYSSEVEDEEEEEANAMQVPTRSAVDIPYEEDDDDDDEVVEEVEVVDVSVSSDRVTNRKDFSSSLSMLNSTTASIEACSSRNSG